MYKFTIKFMESTCKSHKLNRKFTKKKKKKGGKRITSKHFSTLKLPPTLFSPDSGNYKKLDGTTFVAQKLPCSIFLVTILCF
jgi:hypothetical protein